MFPGNGESSRSIIAACLFTGWLFLSCSAHPPELVSISQRLVVYQAENLSDFQERLNLFAIVRDRDGKDDIEALYVIQDEAELFWKLRADNWVYKEDVGEFWLGRNGMAGPERFLPRGQYRLLLVDQAGHRSERSFSLSAAPRTDYSFAQVTLTADNSIELSSPYELNTLFFIDAGNNIIRTVELAPGKHLLDQVWGDATWRSRAVYVAIYSLDIKAETGFFTWKTRLPR